MMEISGKSVENGHKWKTSDRLLADLTMFHVPSGFRSLIGGMFSYPQALFSPQALAIYEPILLGEMMGVESFTSGFPSFLVEYVESIGEFIDINMIVMRIYAYLQCNTLDMHILSVIHHKV